MKLPVYKCLRCDHAWIPRRPDKPRRCPKCKTPYWDTPSSRRVRIADVNRHWLENAKYWVRRANKDLVAFKKFVPFNRQTYKNIRCSDPALAVYLLQQSIEKAVKAVVIASGQYTPTAIRRTFSHNSYDLLLDFYLRVLSKVRDLGLDDLYTLLSGIGVIQAEEKISDARRVSECKELAKASSGFVERLLVIAENIRNDTILKTLKDVFGPHSKVRTQEQNKLFETVEDILEIFNRIWTRDLKQLPPTASQLAIASNVTELFARLFQIPNDEKPTEPITVNRHTETWLSIWSLMSLIIVAALTFPHESSSRYPRLPQVMERDTSTEELDCDDYDQELGIVKHIGHLGYVTQLILNDMDKMLDDVALFFRSQVA